MGALTTIVMLAIAPATSSTDGRVAAVAGPEASTADTEPQSRTTQVRAERREERDRRWYLNGFLLEKADTHLTAVPYRIISASLPLRASHAAELGAGYVAIPRFSIPLPGVRLRGNSLELEGDVLQHFGHETDTETAAAAVLRSGSFGLFGRLSADLAWGNGFSYAFQRPTDETGEYGVRGVDTPHFQYHMSFETELTSGAAPHAHLVLRLHHRSGVYGLISSSRTGSNYLGAGLRFDLGRR